MKVYAKKLEAMEAKGGSAAVKARMLRAGALSTVHFCRLFDGFSCRGLFFPAMLKAGLRAGLKEAVARRLAAHYAGRYEASSLGLL